MIKIKKRRINWCVVAWDLLIGVVGGIALLAIGTMIYLMCGGKL